ncbi:Protein AmpG [BD1-7 clade bacterium]|uniref:Protein AmpG n=1 Tax=BD1-7 clade bacterium TaxID=2029982 RepID=A0A5S9N3E8_9GAMM|nr:Protein AmpG [BD1-7 clade bacterium]
MTNKHNKDVETADAPASSKLAFFSAWRAYLEPRVLVMLFLGFSAGLPLLLIFGTLGLWLREAGFDRADVTYFSWAALGYSFKFVWAPLVGSMPLPFLTRWFGQRRGWLLVSQTLIIAAITGMALINPAEVDNGLVLLAVFAVMLGFSSATQDIVIDAFRIESAPQALQAMMSAMYVAGYRIGVLAAGAGALFLADWWGSSSDLYVYAAWRHTYLCMALLMAVGVVTTLLIAEPESPETADINSFTHRDHALLFLTFVVAVAGFVLSYFYSADLAVDLRAGLADVLNNKVLGSVVIEAGRLISAVVIALLIARTLIKLGVVNRQLLAHSYISPVSEFFSRYSRQQVLLLFLLIALYRMSDIVLGVSANLFYQDMGFSKSQIAGVVKVFGFGMSLLGGFAGGILCLRMGVIRTLFVGGVLSAATNLLFVWMAQVGYNVPMLYLVISADNLAAALAVAAFVAFLSNLVNVSFTAMQYAIFSSLMTLFPKILGGYSGSLVDALGYAQFFTLTALMGLPVLVVIVLIRQKIHVDEPQKSDL